MIFSFIATFFSFWLVAEEPPPPEYPYPETVQVNKAIEDLGVEKPKKKDRRGAYYYDTSKKTKKTQPYKDVEQPYRIGDDGTYYYRDEDEDQSETTTAEGMEKAIRSDDEGGYYYKKLKKPKPHTNPLVGKPAKIESDGTYVYDVDAMESDSTFYFGGGAIGSPNIQPVDSGGRDFGDVYGGGSTFVFAFAYDWNLFSDLFIKLGSGLAQAEGTGQFATAANHPSIQPRESFKFYFFPTTVLLSYRFRIADVQWVTPYIDGGPGYFGFIETRSDGDKTKFGGAPVLAAAGGIMISFNKFTTGTNLLTEYGITQSWFDIQFKQIIGLDERKDFTSNMITGGFALGF